MAAGHHPQTAVVAVGLLQVDAAGEYLRGDGGKVVVVLVPVGGTAPAGQLGEELGAKDV